MLLFGPVLFLLGCVSPYIIKIACKRDKNIGRTVGLFYAVSTIGSFLGTVLTGFILIAYLGVNLIFGIIGVVLICLSVIYFLIFRKKWYLLILIAIPFFIPDTADLNPVVMPNGTKVTRVFSKDSFYGNLKVAGLFLWHCPYTELIIDGLIQGG